MRIDTISSTFVRTLGPELGSSMAAQFSDPSASGKRLQAFLGNVGSAFPLAAFPQAGQQRSAAPQARQPFSGGALSAQNPRPLGVFSNPAQSAGAGVQNVMSMLDQLQKTLSGGITSGNNPGNTSSTDAMVSNAGGNIDSMMSQAQKLLSSDKQSDQIQGQMLMQRAMRLFEMISKMLEQQSQLASKAIQAIR